MKTYKQVKLVSDNRYLITHIEEKYAVLNVQITLVNEPEIIWTVAWTSEIPITSDRLRDLRDASAYFKGSIK